MKLENWTPEDTKIKFRCESKKHVLVGNIIANWANKSDRSNWRTGGTTWLCTECLRELFPNNDEFTLFLVVHRLQS